MIVGDSNMSESAIYLRNGVTALMLSMIEDGAITKNLALRDPVRAIKEVSHDPSLRSTVRLDDGRNLSALEIQCEYLDMALAYAAAHSLDTVTEDVLARWQEVLESLASAPMSLAGQLDWVAKKQLIENFMQRKGLDWGAAQVRMLDLQYHDSRPDKGLYHMLERQGRMERIVTDSEINAAIHTPPVDTRAYFRGECLRRYPDQVFGVNWDSISFGFDDEPIKRVMMSEPLKGTRAHVQDLLNQSENAQALLANMSA